MAWWFLNDSRPAQQGMPPAGLVVVRWMALDGVTPQAEAEWRALLDDAERGRADRFRFRQDRLAFVAAHALTRAMLCRFGGLPASSWRFVTGRFGKPEIDPGLGRPELRFSLSHTRGLVACGVARTADLGVDVEGLERRISVPEIAERFFTPAEAAALAQAPPAARPDVFFQLWTLKEAVMKATGRGFNLPLDAFSIGLDPPSVRFEGDGEGTPADWQLACRSLPACHVLAAALRARGPATFDVQEADGSWQAEPAPSGNPPAILAATRP